MRVTKLQLADIVGRDERTLTRWQNDGMPVLEFGLGVAMKTNMTPWQ